MKHMSVSEWRKYVMDELQEEEREVYENHLYTCDQCLDLYLQAVAACEAELPTMSDEDDFVNTIMAEIGTGETVSVQNEEQARDVVSIQKEQQTKKVVPIERKQQQQKRQPFYQSTAFHYLLATAMTLLLMASGVFSTMIDLTEAIEHPKQVEKASFTEGLLNKTFTWMDDIDEKLKEEPKLKNERKQTKTEEVGK